LVTVGLSIAANAIVHFGNSDFGVRVAEIHVRNSAIKLFCSVLRRKFFAIQWQVSHRTVT